MNYIIIGAIGFIIVHAFDFVSLRRVPRLKPFVWAGGSALLILALVRLSLSPDKIMVPLWLNIVGWVALAAGAGLLIHSLFLNLPFRKTYVSDGVGDRLVTTGFYALVRHPGVIWFTMLMLALIPVSGSRLMLVAAPVFVGLDILLVCLQDRFIFGRMFTGYAAYRQTTPMLIPNRSSILAFRHQAPGAESNTPEMEVDNHD